MKTMPPARRLRVLSQDGVGPKDFAWDLTPHLTGDDRVVAVVATPVRPDASLETGRSRVLADQPEAELAQGVRRGSFVRTRLDEGLWRVLVFLDSPTGQQVKRPTLGMEGSVLDHHSREAMALFLRAAGERVMDALGGADDPPFHSVFCDSLEVYEADWTPDFAAEFQKRRGYDLFTALPFLEYERPEVRDRALACLSRFGQRVADVPPHRIRAVATNTVRQLRAPDAFLVPAEAALGHEIEVVSGREEARLVYLGVAHA